MSEERKGIVTISMDLSFAPKRFCAEEGIEHMRVLCDYLWREFGANYGVLLKEIGLLARSIFVIDKSATIMYKEIVPELTDHPDYDAAFAAVKQAAE